MESLKAYCDRAQTAWDRATKRRRMWIYVGIYTLVFLAAAYLAFLPFWQAGKSLITIGDGYDQHYPNLIYVGRSLRQLLLRFLNGSFTVPLFDLNMNMGDEIIGQLNGLRYADPLVVLSAFVPTVYTEYLYNFLCLLRIYLAGLSFSCLCFHFGKSKTVTLIGSIVYSFSGYAVLTTVRHPMFINSMIVLPLLILGTEKILKRERPYILILATAYGFLCGYYMMYMMTLMVGAYALVRFFDLYQARRWKEFFLAVWRGVTGYLLGAGLAAGVLLPALLDFLQAARSGETSYTASVYSVKYFVNRFLRLITPAKGTGWSYPALAAIVLLALVLLFFTKHRRTLKLLTVLAFATFLTSIGNLVMNGFNYPSARWDFGLVLLLAFIVVEMLPELLDMSGRSQLICALTVGGYLCLVFFYTYARKRPYVVVGVCFLVLSFLVLSTRLGGAETANRAAMKARLRAALCLLAVVINVGVNAVYNFAPDQVNYVGTFTKAGKMTEQELSSIERELEPYYQGEPAGRADGSRFTMNTAMVWRIPGMVVYSSIVKEDVSRFWNAVENSAMQTSFKIDSTDQRTAINTLLSGKYVAETPDRTAYVPYGYTLIEQTKKENLIYENDYALPWGYTYENVISYDDLESLNGLQRQEAMLQAVALEEPGIQTAPSLHFDETRIPYEIECENCTWEEEILTVSAAGATMTLVFDMPADAEEYVRLSQFDLEVSDTEYITVSDGSIRRVSKVVPDEDAYYFGRNSYLFNLGYSDEERTSLTITFPIKGTFKLADIELYALPMANYPAQVEALRAEPLENIHWGTNSLTGTVDLSTDKVLCVSVPYSKGWTAAVDGEKTEILCGNYMFMCLPLTAGHHDIVFSYCSPGLKAGIIISLVSLGIVLYLYFADRKKQREKPEKKGGTGSEERSA